MQYRKITFIGAGNMASALIGGLVNGGYPANLIHVCAPSTLHRDALAQKFGVISSPDNAACAALAEVIVFAVKPKMIADVCADLHNKVDFNNKLLLSIATGITISRFKELLGQHISLIRIMPNTPSLIGKGMSGLYAPDSIDPSDRQYTEEIMQKVGKTCWVTQESGINDIIAVAGSAPAYFFLFMEAMQQEALRLGFDETTSRLLVQQTALGAAAMVAENPAISIATLRQQVTSEGGTTAEALRIFNENQLTEIVAKAMRQAIIRSEEMEKLF